MVTTNPRLFTFLTGMAVSWIVIVLAGCQQNQQQSSESSSQHIPTSVRFNGSSYELLRFGKPYFIKGAGGVSHFRELKECGGNSIRVWDDIDGKQILDEAQRLGLTVMFGVWVERELEGFDYDDEKAVEKQFEQIRKTVLKYRNHPALLMWSVGNEWAMHATNFKVYDEVNRICELIHELDPNHPVTTVISPDSERAIWLVNKRCPDVDILSVNSYGLTEKLPEFLRKGGWEKPYIISEYGAQAYWELPTAPWGAPTEPTSDQKATFVRQFYKKYLAPQLPNCLGGYLFYWGNKQEETHTWFSAFDEQGRKTILVELMQELWSGKPITNHAPVMKSFLVDGKSVKPVSFPVDAATHQASIQVSDPDGDPLTYVWEIKPRAQPGTDYIGVPLQPLQGLIAKANGPSVDFRLPQKPGPYRLFITVYDDHQHLATANFSFEVSAKTVQ